MIEEIITNEFIIVFVAVLVLAQITKAIVNKINRRKVGLIALFKTGYMPSTHCALAASAVTLIYLKQGLSDLFFISLLFVFYVIHNAVVVRKTIGNHSEALNKLLKTKRFEKIIGHTISQAFVGLIFGIIITYVIHGLIQ